MIKATEEYKDKTNSTSTQYLHINSCGLQNISEKEVVILRSHGRVDFQILYIVSGACEVAEGNELHTLAPGDMVLYKPNHRQLYRLCPNSSSYYLHFSGIGAEEVMKSSGLWTEFIVHTPLNCGLTEVFNALVRETVTRKFPYEIMCAGKLLELIAFISRLTNPLNSFAGREHGPVYDIMTYMHAKYAEKINFTELVKSYNISKSRFDHLFKEITGLSPHKYLTKIRLDRAVYMLCNTSLNMTEIAEMTGFSDSLYFSRVFKDSYGLSPTSFRKNSYSGKSYLYHDFHSEQDD